MFPDEHLVRVEAIVPWYVDYVNYLACEVLPPDLSSHQKKKFLYDVRSYLWDDPLLFKRSANQVITSCVPDKEVTKLIIIWKTLQGNKDCFQGFTIWFLFAYSIL